MKKVIRKIKSKAYVLVFLLLGFVAVTAAGIVHDFKPHLSEESWQGYVTWAFDLSFTGNYSAAVRAMETAVEMEPENVQSYIHLAEIHLQNKKFAEAENVYNSAAARFGDNKEINAKLENIKNVNIASIDEAKSIPVSSKEENSTKYSMTREYNKAGYVVSAYGRSHDYRRPDIKSGYEYDSIDRLIRMTEFTGRKLSIASSYMIYEYYDSGAIKGKHTCSYDGVLEEKVYFDEAGKMTQKDVYAEDGSCYVEEYDSKENIIEKSQYDANGELVYDIGYENCDGVEYDEKLTYFNPDDSIICTAYYKYSSSIKSVSKETYFDPDGNVILSLHFERDKYYHVYTTLEADKATEVMSSKFYNEAKAYITDYIGIA